MSCDVNHQEIAFSIGDDGKRYTVKCTNRLCYDFKLRDSDLCLYHHLRDEHK